MRIAAVAIAASALAAGCGGGGPRANVRRPPAPVTMTAAIHDDVVQVSPARVGAGPIVLVVSNQTAKPQRVTFETDELGGSRAGRIASTPVIPAQGTGRLTIDARSGRYAVHVRSRAIRAAHVRVGAPRKSSQNDLLLP
ncbi:hypothetical protein [Candidatus Solirubrobacter pratensis]|uniref:hypothetical protein n=1 Tax=Candidatus Solirubrobacter pratensis TaxID=1298857 RepID=UPI0003FFEB1A|nr:hypothetical protein [Candidatus Solirubrobacter pratensis]